MQKLLKLDEKMNGVLDRRDLDNNSKATACSQVLVKCLGVREQLHMPKPIHLIEKTSTKTHHRVSPSIPTSPNINNDRSGQIWGHDTINDNDNDRIKSDDIDVTPFAKVLREHALHLLNHMSKQQDMSWNERGELMIDDKPYLGYSYRRPRG